MIERPIIGLAVRQSWAELLNLNIGTLCQTHFKKKLDALQISISDKNILKQI